MGTSTKISSMGGIRRLRNWRNISNEKRYSYHKEGSGKQTKYDYNLVPKVSEVPAEFLAKELKDKKTRAEIVEKWKADSKAGHTGDDVDGVDDFEMPPVDPFGGEGADEKVIQA